MGTTVFNDLRPCSSALAALRHYSPSKIASFIQQQIAIVCKDSTTHKVCDIIDERAFVNG